MREKIINNFKKYRYDWFSIMFILFLLFTEHVIFVVLLFISVLMSELKK